MYIFSTVLLLLLFVLQSAILIQGIAAPNMFVLIGGIMIGLLFLPLLFAHYLLYRRTLPYRSMGPVYLAYGIVHTLLLLVIFIDSPDLYAVLGLSGGGLLFFGLSGLYYHVGKRRYGAVWSVY